MEIWEVAAQALAEAHAADREWLNIGEITRDVVRLAPGTNPATVHAIVRYHCINDPSKKRSAGDLYRNNPRFITDDPTMRGKRYRLLTDDERRAFLTDPRMDLELHSYVQVLDWLRDPSDSLPEDGSEPDLEVESSSGDDLPGVALLEIHLQDYLFRNWATHFPGLRPYQGERGREFITRDPSVGILDFLATDAEGNFVVIETKRDMADRKAVGQILGYMGWVSQKLAAGKSVRGILITGSVSDTLRLAAAAAPNLDLVVYEISFALRADEAN